MCSVAISWMDSASVSLLYFLLSVTRQLCWGAHVSMGSCRLQVSGVLSMGGALVGVTRVCSSEH